MAIVDPEVVYQQPLVGIELNSITVSTVSSSLSKYHLGETKQSETVDCDWRAQIKISEEYEEYKEAFLEIL